MSCGTVQDLIDTIREQLQDNCDVKRYSDDFLIRRINLALHTIYLVRPDGFSPKIIYHELKPGIDQELPENITVFEFLGTGYKNESGGNTDCADGVKPTESNGTFLSIYANRAETSGSSNTGTATAETKCSAYSIKSFSYEQTNGRYFSVSPAVPTGGDLPSVKLLASSCPKCAPEGLNEQLPCRFYPLILEKTLALTFAAEAEDASNMAKAAAYEARFADLLKAQYHTDSRLGSGYWLGRSPTGDPDPRVLR